MFRDWLDEHYPDRAAKVMSTINSMRGGRDNDPNFFSRMSGQGPWAELLRTRFEIAAKKYGLRRAKFELRRDLFSPGMHLPVRIEKELPEPPDIYYVLAWNFKREILANNQRLLEQGVEFYFPVDPQD